MKQLQKTTFWSNSLLQYMCRCWHDKDPSRIIVTEHRDNFLYTLRSDFIFHKIRKKDVSARSFLLSFINLKEQEAHRPYRSSE